MCADAHEVHLIFVCSWLFVVYSAESRGTLYRVYKSAMRMSPLYPAIHKKIAIPVAVRGTYLHECLVCITSTAFPLLGTHPLTDSKSPV